MYKNKGKHYPFTKEQLLDDFWGAVNQNIIQNGDKEFIVTRNKKITYKQADFQSNKISKQIRSYNNNSASGIGIFLNDPIQLVPCMMGILKSGNYIIPLDVAYPVTTILSMIKDTNIKIFLTNSQHIHRLSEMVGEESILLNLDDLDFSEEIFSQKINYQLDDIVQILFTSGSSGQPKGAIEDYRYLIRASYIKTSTFEYEHDDKLLLLSSFTFSSSHSAIFSALLVGFTLYFHNVKENGFNGLAEWIREKGINAIKAIPTTFRSLLTVFKPTDVFPSVNTIFLGGEKRLRSDMDAVYRFFPNANKIRLGYAGTEMFAVSTSIYTYNEIANLELLTCGLPFPDLQVLIWDENGNSVPRGTEGEIVIYGDSLARGYINNPVLTQQKFIKDLQNPPWQFYKTGDLGKLLDDGQLVHLGRIDNMVKIRGVRIELDNLENVILSYPGIIQVASRVLENDQGTKKLASYFVSEKGINIPISDLRKYLSDKLPLQQLPNYLVELPEMPLTYSGKVALDLLPLPNTVRPNLSNSFIPPANNTEQKLVKIWEDNIGVTGIGVTDDFFELGGDSLIGVLVFVAVEESFGIELPVSTLLRIQTIRELAKVIEGTKLDEHFEILIPINPSGTKPPLFFVPGKGGYPTRIRHLASRIDKDTPVYALQDLETVGLSKNKRSIEETATIFLKEIERFFPQGPYVLVGESVGGKIAFEMAQQIAVKKDGYPLLFLLDTNNTEDSIIDKYNQKHKIPYYKMLIQKHYTIWRNSDNQGKKDYLKFYRENLNGKLTTFLGRRFRKLFKAKNKSKLGGINTQENGFQKVSASYVTKPYPGQVILVKALRGPSSGTVANGWDKIEIGNLIIEGIDCYHGSILFDPAVSHLAKIVQSYIDQYSKEDR
jgi:amino acid adenylation domain-containing protein